MPKSKGRIRSEDPSTMRRLYRSGNDRVLGGVCGGLGEYFGVDPTLVRLAWIIMTLISFGFGGVVAYVIAWIVIPRNPKHRWNR